MTDTTRPIPPPRRNMSAPQARAGAEVFDEAGWPAGKPQITLSTTIAHRGRQITITTTDMTADQFCDLLDRRGFQAPEEPQQWQTLPDGTPICPKHHAPMRLREKQGDSWYSHNVGTKEQPVYCKGYHGKDSPGYES